MVPSEGQPLLLLCGVNLIIKKKSPRKIALLRIQKQFFFLLCQFSKDVKVTLTFISPKAKQMATLL